MILVKYLNLSFFVLIMLAFLLIASCAKEYDSITCISRFVSENVNTKELQNFTSLEGISVWREWDEMTTHLAEEVSSIRDCGVYTYMRQRGESMDSLKGRMILVYSIHSYLKNGFVDEETIENTVDGFLEDDY